jgi:hypothetical protein
MDFREFSKIPRLSREMFITEKIDGTNALISINDEGDFCVGSRTRWLAKINALGEDCLGEKIDDNHGFRAWALAHKEELMTLGTGFHYGEWWGSGIQRGYGLPKGEKRFSLFNVSRWADDAVRPACCYVVPTLYVGMFDTDTIKSTLWLLEQSGSMASLGFKPAEGVVIYHVAANMYFKKTILHDESPKGLVKE